MRNVREEKWWARLRQSEKALNAYAHNTFDSSMVTGPSPEIELLYREGRDGSLLQVIAEKITDRRNARGKRFPYVPLIFVAACCGFTGSTEIARFLMFNMDCFYPIFNRIPSHDTFAKLLNAADPKEVAECLQIWLNKHHQPAVPTAHWMVEGEQNVLDIQPDEDEHNTSEGYAFENEIILRKFAVQLQDSDPVFSQLPSGLFQTACYFNLRALANDFLS